MTEARYNVNIDQAGQYGVLLSDIDKVFFTKKLILMTEDMINIRPTSRKELALGINTCVGTDINPRVTLRALHMIPTMAFIY